MRALLCISAVALLAACSDDRPVTAPPASTSAPAGAVAGPASVIAQAAAKPIPFAITPVAGPAETVFGEPGHQGAVSIAMCPAGSVVVGGGFSISMGQRDLRITQSKPNATGTGWMVFGAWYGEDFTGTNYATFSAVATCIK